MRLLYIPFIYQKEIKCLCCQLITTVSVRPDFEILHCCRNCSNFIKIKSVILPQLPDCADWGRIYFCDDPINDFDDFTMSTSELLIDYCNDFVLSKILHNFELRRLICCNHQSTEVSLSHELTLETIEFYDCPSLTQIQLSQNLQTLLCSHCPMLSNISLTNWEDFKMETILCYDCHSLTQIPYFPNLKELICHDCPLLTDISIPMINRLLTFVHSGCDWLKCSHGFDQKIEKLVVLQKWFKKIYLSKRIIKLIKQLVPIYYHPKAKGGYFHKKSIEDFLTKIGTKDK